MAASVVSNAHDADSKAPQMTRSESATMKPGRPTKSVPIEAKVWGRNSRQSSGWGMSNVMPG